MTSENNRRLIYEITIQKYITTNLACFSVDLNFSYMRMCMGLCSQYKQIMDSSPRLHKTVG